MKAPDSDEATRLTDRSVGHAEPESETKRVGKKNQQKRRRGQHQRDAKKIAVIEQTKGEPSPRRDRPGGALSRRE